VLSIDRLGSHHREPDLAALGDRWLDTGASAVLQVPSAVVPSEFNYMLNPTHPDFSKIVAEVPVQFMFDKRLFPIHGSGLL
jgi:RES domain-containing protein